MGSATTLRRETSPVISPEDVFFWTHADAAKAYDVHYRTISRWIANPLNKWRRASEVEIKAREEEAAARSHVRGRVPTRRL